MEQKDLKEQLRANPFLALNDIIYQLLFDDIIYLRIPPSSKINEKQIAESLGVSRSPVNTALQRLCDDGLLIKDGRKNLYVAPMEKKECRQLYESRIALEGYAAYLCVFRIEPPQIEHLEQSIEEFERAIIEDITTQAKYDALFHSIIIDSAQNPYIAAMYKTTEYALLRYRNLLCHEVSHDSLCSFLQLSCKSHRAIKDAIKLGFADTARKEMERHIATMLDAIREWK